ncbi:hypothetical protein Tco_1460199 [Tanacetum coccineum]
MAMASSRVCGFEAVTFPLMLCGSPPMKASISFLVIGTMFGHKTANSWNLLIPSDHVGLFYSNRLGICIPPRQGIIGERVSLGSVFLLGLLVFAMVTACASRAATMPLAISYWMEAKVMAGVSDVDDITKILECKTSRDRHGDNRMSDPRGGLVYKDQMFGGGVVDLTGDEDPTDEDGGTGNDDSTGVSMSLGDEISLGGKKSWESNSDNTGDGGTTIGGVIGA